MKPVKILVAASEMAPFAKVGGLADVVGTLPGYLNKQNCDTRVILPLYRFIKERYAEKLQFIRWSIIRMGWRKLYSGLFQMDHNGVTVYFIDNEYYFGHDAVYLDYSFDIERFSFYQRAVLEAIGMPMGFNPDVIHCNDWQTGMIPCLLDAHYRPQGYHRNVKTVFTIHNLKHQGIHGLETIADLMDMPDHFMSYEKVLKDGVPNFMKAGIVFSDWITTVSPTYAEEMLTPELGEGLNEVLRHFQYKITGILNGIDTDEFNPADDPALAENYDVPQWKDGKAACKRALQLECGLDVRDDVPLAVMISRLVDQKGMDLLIQTFDAMLDLDMQIVVQGTGDPYYEQQVRAAAARNSGRMAAALVYDNELAHRIYAGADLFLMPSLFEPCGLSQMIAMRYGTVPIARQTGGLKDTVHSYNPLSGEGNGFTFSAISAADFLAAVNRARSLYETDRDAWAGLVLSGMKGDYSWDRSAAAYAALFARITGAGNA